jgi:hypothetical protein
MTTEELEAIARRLVDSAKRWICFTPEAAAQDRQRVYQEILQALKDVRRETLEEAARICDNLRDDGSDICAEAIRARLDLIHE